MCGILGRYDLGSKPEEASSRLSSALHALRHRGPNDQGIEIYQVGSGRLQLGHTRLSIIDLSSAGHQPMKSPDGRFTIVFNGEIYNYRELRSELIEVGYQFQTESDTEVLLAAWAHWKSDCLPKLVGMFAFGIVDHGKNILTLVRDPFGVKPLYYSQSAQQFAFASELPALQIVLGESRLNYQRAYDYLVWGSYDDQAATLLEGCYQVQPGHLMEINFDCHTASAPRRWWWPSIQVCDKLSFDQAAEAYRSLFLDSVRLHLRSDVPLGAALSGGLDSSAIVCAMRHIEPDLPIHTFSFIAEGSQFNEEKWIDRVNQHVNAHAYKVVVQPTEILNDLDDLIMAQGEPFMTSSIYAQYRVFKLARDNGITVTLDGQGADESLAGYDGYPHGRIASLLQQRRPWELAEFIYGWSRWPGRSLKQAIPIFLQQACPEFLFAMLRKKRGSAAMPNWINRSLVGELGLDDSLPRLHPQDDSYRRGLSDKLRTALTVRGLQALLRHGDRNSMRWSIESRVPFLAVPQVEFLLTLPETYLISQQGETKRILRQAMQGIVPAEVLARKDKIGFMTPEADWLRHSQVSNWMDNSLIDQIPFLNSRELNSYIHDQLTGKTTYSQQTWRILNFCKWFRIFQPSV